MAAPKPVCLLLWDEHVTGRQAIPEARSLHRATIGWRDLSVQGTDRKVLATQGWSQEGPAGQVMERHLLRDNVSLDNGLLRFLQPCVVTTTSRGVWQDPSQASKAASALVEHFFSPEAQKTFSRGLTKTLLVHRNGRVPLLVRNTLSPREAGTITLKNAAKEVKVKSRSDLLLIHQRAKSWRRHPQGSALDDSSQSPLLPDGSFAYCLPTARGRVPGTPPLCLGKEKEMVCPQQGKTTKGCILQYPSSLMEPWSDRKLLKVFLGCYSELLRNPESLTELLPAHSSSSSLRPSSAEGQQKFIYCTVVLTE